MDTPACIANYHLEVTGTGMTYIMIMVVVRIRVGYARAKLGHLRVG